MKPIFICGASGSGKTRLAKLLAKGNSVTVVGSINWKEIPQETETIIVDEVSTREQIEKLIVIAFKKVVYYRSHYQSFEQPRDISKIQLIICSQLILNIQHFHNFVLC